MSGSFESVGWTVCVHRLDFSYSLIQKSFGGMESEPMLTPRENPLYLQKFSPEEDQTPNAASSRTASPTHYQQAISAPANCFGFLEVKMGERGRDIYIYIYRYI